MRNAIILFLLTGICSCLNTNKTKQNPTSHNIDTIEITPDENAVLKLIDIEEFKIIPLETSEKSIVSSNEVKYFEDGLFYILDPIGQSICIFDSTGRFHHKIQDIGRGPNEYLEATDFSLKEGHITILDNKLQKMVHYKEDYSVERSNQLSGWGNLLLHGEEQLYVVNTFSLCNQNYNLYSIDHKGEIQKSFLPFNENDSKRMISYTCYTESPNHSLLHISTLDTIYQLTNSDCKPKYVLNYGKQALPSKYKTRELIDLIKSGIEPQKYILGPDKIWRDKGHVYIKYQKGGNSFVSIYNTDKKESSDFKWFDYKGLSFMPCLINDKYYIYTLSASDFLISFKYAWAESIKDDTLRKQLEQIYNSIDDCDNGIILLLKRKS